MSDNKVVITAALTGVLATQERCPYIPYTLEEVAEEGRRAVEAGAAILHIHARQPNGLPAFDVETYRQIYEEGRKRNPDVIINFSMGAVGLPREERIHHIRALRPDMAALNMGSMNYAIYSSNAISHYKLSFWAAASALWALAAAVRARPSPLRIKKALASKWY